MHIYSNTAYFGFLNICQPKAGDVVVVTGAGGAVGSLVGQIAKLKECVVIGFTGDDSKCKWLKESCGFDHVINYKTEVDVAAALHAVAPTGVDCYFNNVGGELSSTIIHQMRENGRIAVCGSISSYNLEERPKVVDFQRTFVQKQLSMKGFIVIRYMDRWMDGIEAMYKWVDEGKLKYHETIWEGFRQLPQAFIEMMQGKNMGKAIVRSTI